MSRYAALSLVLVLGCNGSTDKTTGTDIDVILGLTPDEANGDAVYAANCAICHGADGTGVSGLGSDISAETDQRLIVDSVLNGNDEGMTAFGDILTDQEIADVSGFVAGGGLGG